HAAFDYSLHSEPRERHWIVQMPHEAEKHYPRRLSGHARDFRHRVNRSTAHQSSDRLRVSKRLIVLYDANTGHCLMVSRTVEKHDIARTDIFRRRMGEVGEFD